MSLKPLPVDLSELVSAFDNDGGDQDVQTRAFFDLWSGEIEYLPFELEDESLFADVLQAPERWLRIPSLGTAERRRARSTFVDDVNDPQLRLQLADALASPDQAFAAFAQLLRRTRGLFEQWLHHRDRSLTGPARAWLASLGIAPASDR